MDLVDQLSPRGFDCVCGNLRMAARAVTSVYDRHLADAGVQRARWRCSGRCPRRGITVKQLAERIAMHETTLIRNLRILEREGWVALEVGIDDRRQRIPSLTRQGRAVFGKALVGWKKAQSEVAGLIDEKLPDTNRRLVRLTRALERLTAARAAAPWRRIHTSLPLGQARLTPQPLTIVVIADRTRSDEMTKTMAMATTTSARRVRMVMLGMLVSLLAVLSLSVCGAAGAASARQMDGGPGMGHMHHARRHARRLGGGMMFGGSPERMGRMIDHMLDGLNASDAQRSQIKQIAAAPAPT